MRRLGDEEEYSAKRRRKLRRALLSVYYHTVAREFEIRGAPSVLLPPEIDPMSLRDALAVIAVSRPPRLLEALWRVVRTVPFTMNLDVKQYPSALAAYLNQDDLKKLNQYRQDYRKNSEQFSDILRAIRGNNFNLAHSLQQDRALVRNATTTSTTETGMDFTTALKLIVGYSDGDYVKRLLAPLRPPDGEEVTRTICTAESPAAALGTAGKTRQEEDSELKLSRQIAAMSSSVGLSITELVETLADIAAFEAIVPMCLRRKFGDKGVGPADNVIIVYPVNTIVKQQTSSMAVSATVTTIVKGPFEALTHAMDPAHWACSSDIIQKSEYVDDIFTLQRSDQSRDTPPEGGVSGLLDEKVTISWDESEVQQAQYHNVLNTRFSVQEPKGKADVDYNLCRSIKSSILWERGPGGLLLDQGYIKLRKLGENVWRVTMHKEVLFGDANGSGALTGPRDLGQLISYLAPVALSYWLESEIYSLADPHPHDDAQELRNRLQDNLPGMVEDLYRLWDALTRQTASRRDSHGQQS